MYLFIDSKEAAFKTAEDYAKAVAKEEKARQRKRREQEKKDEAEHKEALELWRQFKYKDS